MFATNTGITLSRVSDSLYTLYQGWAISGPPQRFQQPTETFRKNLQIWNFLQLSQYCKC